MERPKSPTYTVPAWAPLSTPNYPAGTDPWSSNPIRIAPPGSNYFTPGPNAAAQFFNYLIGTQADNAAKAKDKLSDLVDFVGQVQAQNIITGRTPVSGSLVNCRFAYDEYLKRWLASAGTTLSVSDDGGQTWYQMFDSGGPSTVSASHVVTAMSAGHPSSTSLIPGQILAVSASNAEYIYTDRANAKSTLSGTIPWVAAAYTPVFCGYSLPDDCWWVVATSGANIRVYNYQAALNTWTTVTGTFTIAGVTSLAPSACTVAGNGDLWIVGYDATTGNTVFREFKYSLGTTPGVGLTKTQANLGISPALTTGGTFIGEASFGYSIAIRDSSVLDETVESNSQYSRRLCLNIWTQNTGNSTPRGVLLDLPNTADLTTTLSTPTQLTNLGSGTWSGNYRLLRVARRGDMIFAVATSSRVGVPDFDSKMIMYSPDAGVTWYKGAPYSLGMSPSFNISLFGITPYNGGFQILSNQVISSSINMGYGAGVNTPALGDRMR